MNLFTSEGTERNSDRTRLEDFYYSAIYDAIQEPITHTQKMTTLKKLKAKLIRLNSTHRQKIIIIIFNLLQLGFHPVAVVFNTYTRT